MDVGYSTQLNKMSAHKLESKSKFEYIYIYYQQVTATPCMNHIITVMVRLVFVA